MITEESKALEEVKFGDLRRTTPLHRDFGFQRGQPVDRYYIERFLAQHSDDIAGHVLEIGDNHYTRLFGGSRVTRSDILDLARDDSIATITADLTSAEHIPDNSFDCLIVTQTLQYIYDLPAAVNTLHRILHDGGVLLLTVPVISQICRFDMDRWGDYWRFTNASVERLLGSVFHPAAVEVAAHGNVLASICFLHGLAASDLEPQELNFHDPDYQLVITARAVKDSRRESR